MGAVFIGLPEGIILMMLHHFVHSGKSPAFLLRITQWYPCLAQHISETTCILYQICISYPIYCLQTCFPCNVREVLFNGTSAPEKPRKGLERNVPARLLKVRIEHWMVKFGNSYTDIYLSV